MNKKFLGVACVAALGLAAAPASAVFVTEWTYNATLEWVTAGPAAPTFTTGGGTQTIASSLLSWGAAAGNHLVDNATPINSRSGIEITDSPATGPVGTNAGFVNTTVLTHYNNAISGTFATLTSATLLTTLTLTPSEPAGEVSGDTVGPFIVQFTTNFIETVNTGPADGSDCGFPAVTACDDIFVVDVPDDLTGTFVVDGITYTAQIGVAGLGPLPTATCLEAGRGAGCIGLTTPENAFTPVQVSFAITGREVSVPEPTTVALFGLGLLGLGAVAATRRRRQE